jgi:DNA primase
LLDDIAKDLFNYDLEFRIQELESKFSKDMSETTFNKLKELKNERKIN